MPELRIHAGDCRRQMRCLIGDGEQFDSIITDPPYHLESVVKRFGKEGYAPAGYSTDGRFARASKGFMGKSWDGADENGVRIAFDPEIWKLMLLLLKPGGFCLAFASPRTGHRQACAMEDAGFIMHPFHGWLYGQGMPKGHSLSRGIDAATLAGGGGPEGIRRLAMGEDYAPSGRGRVNYDDGGGSRMNGNPAPHEPITEAAREWAGWYGGAAAVKPALEPVYIGQRPLSERTIAANVLRHRVGAMNIDACRVVSTDREATPYTIKRMNPGATNNRENGTWNNQEGVAFSGVMPKDRWPSNLAHDGSPEVVACFPDSKGQIARARNDGAEQGNQVYGARRNITNDPEPRGDDGSAARFFNAPPVTWCPKASPSERKAFRAVNAAGEEHGHPTTKPQWLIEHYIKLVTPLGGRVLDPFAGSGTTGAAANRLGMDADLIEADPAYLEGLQRRFHGRPAELAPSPEEPLVAFPDDVEALL